MNLQELLTKLETPIVKHSVLRLNRYFDGLDGWDEAAIADRGRELAEMMGRVRPRPEQAA